MLRAAFTREFTQAEIDDGTAADADDWQPVDPDQVTAKVGLTDTSGDVDPLTVTLHDWLGSPNDIVRDDVGLFHLDFTPNADGKWCFRFEGIGAGQSAAEHTFIVNPSKFP